MLRDDVPISNAMSWNSIVPVQASLFVRITYCVADPLNVTAPA